MKASVGAEAFGNPPADVKLHLPSGFMRLHTMGLGSWGGSYILTNAAILFKSSTNDMLQQLNCQGGFGDSSGALRRRSDPHQVGKAMKTACIGGRLQTALTDNKWENACARFLQQSLMHLPSRTLKPSLPCSWKPKGKNGGKDVHHLACPSITWKAAQ